MSVLEMWTCDEIYSYKELYIYICEYLNLKRFFIYTPFFVVKILLGLLKLTPIKLLTKDQLILLKEDNISSKKYLTFKELNIVPKNTKEMLKIILKH